MGSLSVYCCVQLGYHSLIPNPTPSPAPCSLGGALALLLAALAQLELGAPRSGLRCYSFGSPPVLAHASGAGGDAVLQARCKPRHAQQPPPDALRKKQALLSWASLKSGLPRCSLAPPCGTAAQSRHCYHPHGGLHGDAVLQAGYAALRYCPSGRAQGACCTNPGWETDKAGPVCSSRTRINTAEISAHGTAHGASEPVTYRRSWACPPRPCAASCWTTTRCRARC